MEELSERAKIKALTGKDYLLSIQHLFAMFGATVLVPLITGMNPSVALLSAGAGTLIYHLCTKGKVPVFLGSSFAFLSAISLYSVDGVLEPDRLPKVQGGIIFAGLLYVIFSIIAYLVGPDRVKKAFPPLVTGPVIVVIGIQLSSTAIADTAGGTWPQHFDSTAFLNIGIAIFAFLVVVACQVFAKGYAKIIPILCGLCAGYVLCILLCALGVLDWSYMNFEAVDRADWINIPFVTKDANNIPFMSLPEFDIGSILSIAPIAFVTLMEHIGDITTNGMVVGKDFLKNPGLHRTLLGDGLATVFAGLIGGPANTTYSENTGVLAATKNYNPLLLRITAVLAILLGFIGKFGAILQTIPCAIKGGVEIMLFGMIASVGIRTISEAKINFGNPRNLIVVGLILVAGLGINGQGGINFTVGSLSFTITGLFVAVFVGVIANALLPDGKDESANINK